MNRRVWIGALGFLLIAGWTVSLETASVWSQDKKAEAKKEKKGEGKKEDDSLNHVGRWKEYKVGEKVAAIVFSDKNGWHLKFTSPKGKNVEWQGTIKSDKGALKPLQAQGERSANIYKTDLVQWKSDKEIAFRIRTSGADDEINFTVHENTTSLEIVIKLNDEDRPRVIHIGRDGQSPPSSKFTLSITPEKK